TSRVRGVSSIERRVIASGYERLSFSTASLTGKGRRTMQSRKATIVKLAAGVLLGAAAGGPAAAQYAPVQPALIAPQSPKPMYFEKEAGPAPQMLQLQHP